MCTFYSLRHLFLFTQSENVYILNGNCVLTIIYVITQKRHCVLTERELCTYYSLRRFCVFTRSAQFAVAH